MNFFKGLVNAVSISLLLWAVIMTLLIWHTTADADVVLVDKVPTIEQVCMTSNQIECAVHKAHPVCTSNIVKWVHRYPKEVARMCRLVGDFRLADLIDPVVQTTEESQ